MIVFLCYGNGSFAYRGKYETSFPPNYLGMDDFNNDNQLHIVVVRDDIVDLLGYSYSLFAYPILYTILALD